MKSPSLGRMPSERHIIWSSDSDDGMKRFRQQYLQTWCSHYDFDFENYNRVDHARADEVRTQYQCVFSYQDTAVEDFEFGGDEWSIKTADIPQTFIEIDDEGWMRVQGWSSERIVDVVELWHEGPELVAKVEGEEGTLRLDTRELTR
jgi:hypothetical protein